LEFLIPPVPHVVFSLFFGNSAADSRKSGTCPIKKEASKSGCQEGKWENTKSENMLFSGQPAHKHLADQQGKEAMELRRKLNCLNFMHPIYHLPT